MNEFKFTFVITKPLVDEIIAADKLYKYIDDCIFSVCENVYSIKFNCISSSMEKAIDTAIKNINKAKIGIEIISIIYNT